ncbi:MAG: VaFE repeat-containing surface-anchored protein [Ruminococcus sp.]|nr:VaFE repeat-containing surface-anchored protein [Ruminococcus sp.]
MEKILKRLLTGILAFVTVLATLPVTKVDAAEQVYTDMAELAGKIIKVDNSGLEVDSLEENVMNADGQIAYCIDIDAHFTPGYKNRINASDRMSSGQITDVALSLEYVKRYVQEHAGFSTNQIYLLEQCIVWRRLSVFLGWGYNNVHADFSEIPEAIQAEIYENAKRFVTENKDRYDCGGYIYTGEGQDLGQFWANLATGNGKIQKVSANAGITNSNNCYSLSGAAYGIYSDKGCTQSVASLTTDGNGNTNIVELRAGTYYVKETKAPKGFQLDKTVYTLAVNAGNTATLRVSDTPKVMDTVIELFKVDMETAKGTPQGNAALEGAEFVWKYYDGYYTRSNLPSTPTRTWTTRTKAERGSDGAMHYVTRLSDSYKVSGDSFYKQNGAICLPLGTITVEEKSAPNGYLLDGAYLQVNGTSEQVTGVYTAQITESGELATLSGGNQYSVSDKVIRGGVKIQKRDLETKDTKPQGGAILKDTAFTITTLNENPVLVGGKLYQKNEVVKTIRTGSDGIATTAANTLPYGHYRLDEVTPPEGYLTDGAVSREFEIVSNGQIIDLTTAKESIYNQIIRGGVKIQKRDLETKDATPQGSATFNDTVFTITTLSENPVLVDGKLYKKNEVVKTIHTGLDGIATTTADTLPYGHYRLDEVTPPEGYLTDGAVSREFEVVNDGETVDLTLEEKSVYNQIKRGDIEGVKIGSGTHKRLADVPFKITSKTTGESHVIVTDKNGQFSTAADWTSHKKNTNAGKSSEDGIWFGTSEPDDSKGALLYDTYEIKELRCDSNKGLSLIPAFDVIVSRDKVIIDLGTLTDEYEPELTIHTTAADKATGEKSIIAGKSVTIVDTVALDGLKKGTKYQLKGWEMVKSENVELLIDGERVENDFTFTAKDSKMEVELSFTFNASELAGKELVTFEELFDMTNPEEPVKVAEHKDIEDDGQTVTIEERVITIHTTATDKATDEKMILASKDVTIVDTVSLEGLEKGTKYQLKGWEMVKSENAELLMDGKRVENDLTFTATDSEMEVQIAFTINASELAGKELVTFEELYDMTNPEEPVKVAEHKDIENDGQTVTITERMITMHTNAADKATGEKTIEAGKDVTIVDTVTLDGIEKGVKYMLKGWEMVKSENTELIVNGKRVKNDLTFTATDNAMEIQIAFTFNSSELAGEELVTFEELYDVTNPDNPIKVAEHKDIEDKGQTVTITDNPEEPATPEEPDTPTSKTNIPKTGDTTSFVALITILFLSAAGLVFMAYRKYRSMNRRND